MPNFIDLTGMQFERWTVIKKSEKKSKEIYWECLCSCKNKTKKDVAARSLRGGRSKSCGCLQKETASILGKNKKKYNKYKIINDNVVEMITTNTKEKFCIDLIDFNKIKDYAWRYGTWGHICTTVIEKGKRKSVILHRLLMDFPNKIIDHKDRNPLNNRRSNLRLVTQKENQQNFSKSSRNTSGHIGVHKNKYKTKWVARIFSNNQSYHLGEFENKEEAIIYRLKAELKYFGKDFAPQRHLFNQYGIE